MFGSDLGIVNRIRRWRLTTPRALSRALAATLFPPRCCLCGLEAESLDLDLCQVCFEDLPWASGTASSFVALRFDPPVDELIRQLKYNGALPNARVLGVLLARSVRDRGGDLPRLLVPVPLHASRLRERGFNQAQALARYAGRLLEIPSAPFAVHRLRDTPTQTGLHVHERRRNVRGAFAVNSRARARLLAAGHVAVLDDVMTTGSTMNEVRTVLREAGVRRVDVWAVARAQLQAARPPDSAR